jgi:hypothetical protein
MSTYVRFTHSSYSNHQMVEIIAPEAMPEGYKFSTEYNGVIFHAIVVSFCGGLSALY